ncbi:MAG: DUF4349 domain-containing protein [Ruthenibacterium lactatiformans]
MKKTLFSILSLASPPLADAEVWPAARPRPLIPGRTARPRHMPRMQRNRRSGRDSTCPRRQNSGSAAPGRRKIILNATLSIEALDFNATCTALERAAQSCGGYVSSTSIDTPAYEGAYRTAYYEFRIPAEQYSVFLEGAGSAGNLVSKQESTQDVSSAYVDVEARLKSLKLQEERLYAMMEQAGDLERRSPSRTSSQKCSTRSRAIPPSSTPMTI